MHWNGANRFVGSLSRLGMFVVVLSGIAIQGCGGGKPQSSNPLGDVAPVVSACRTGATGAITVSIANNRGVGASGSGVGPLAVIFDATSTTSGTPGIRPFHDLVYTWDFGDSVGNPTWANGSRPSANSKNSASGAVAGHVFERPGGPYKVTLTVTDGTNQVIDECTQITVVAPDLHPGYAGVGTTCIGNALPVAGAGGCPVGARVTMADAAGVVTPIQTAIQAALAAGSRRILLNRGDTFTGTNWVVATQAGPVTIGVYGAGAKPVINFAVASSFLFLLNNAPTDWRFMDLDFNGGGINSKFSSPGGTGLSDFILYLNLTIRNSGGMNVTRTNLAIVDNDIGPVIGGSGNNGIYAQDIFGFFIAGNRISDTTGGEHGIRIQGGTTGAVTNNTVGNSAPTKHAFTLRGNDTVPYVTRHIVIGDNEFAWTIANNWLTTIAPQNATRLEVIQDVVAERNLYSSPGSSVQTLVKASDVTIRNNLFNLSNVGTGPEIAYDSVVGLPHSTNVRIYNNSFVANAGTQFSAVTISDALSTSTVIRNNLAYAPSSTRDSSNNGTAGTFLNNQGASGVITSNNSTDAQVKGTDPVFGNFSLIAVADWKPQAGSYAIGAGTAVPILGVNRDFFGVAQPSPTDLGAVVH